MGNLHPQPIPKNPHRVQRDAANGQTWTWQNPVRWWLYDRRLNITDGGLYARRENGSWGRWQGGHNSPENSRKVAKVQILGGLAYLRLIPSGRASRVRSCGETAYGFPICVYLWHFMADRIWGTDKKVITGGKESENEIGAELIWSYENCSYHHETINNRFFITNRQVIHAFRLPIISK
jgi:hypothetical protein